MRRLLVPALAAAPVRVPVVKCVTEVGAPAPVRPLPAHEPVVVPPGLGGRVALYVDADHRVRPVLAPRGWRCHALDAADGQAGVEVVSPRGARGGLVAASWDGPCRSCVAADVCRFSARPGFAAGAPGAPPCAVAPAGERWRFLRGSATSARALVAFVERPGARVGLGSWPARPAVGLATAGRMAYDLAGAPWARIVTCALPTSLADLCAPAVARA